MPFYEMRSFYAGENHFRSGSIIITRFFSPKENDENSGGFIILAIKEASYPITKAGFMRDAVGHLNCC